MAPSTTAAAAAARERQRAQFLAQFAATVFAQWRAGSEKERFWLDATFLRGLLEAAAAKLPTAAPLKGELTRELAAATAELRRLLDALYVDLQTQQPVQESEQRQQLLLSEEAVERALATADTAARRELAAQLALDEDEDETAAAVGVAQVEALVVQLQLVGARAYESEGEQSRKRALLVQRVVRGAEQLVRGWVSGNWDCASTSVAAVELERLRAALQRIVAVDAVSAAASDVASSSSAALLGSPWSAFYRPPESAQLRKADYEAEVAKLYGLLLTLAVYFPLVVEDADTSDESSDSDSDESEKRTRAATASKPLDCLEQARQTVRHVAFAARKRADASWLVAVLTFLHELPKPAGYSDADGEDEEAIALDAGDLRALQDCLCDVYTRALAHPQVLADYALTDENKRSDWELFRTVVCVRRAAQFMRSERRQTIPAVTTAMTKLASIPLPTSFWAWVAHAKKVFAQQSAAVREVTKKLSKAKAAKMASTLLSVTEVTDAELAATAENYEAFLQRQPDELYVAVVRDASEEPVEGVRAAAAESDALFFTDSVGGKKSATEKKNKKKKKAKTPAGQQQQAVGSSSSSKRKPAETAPGSSSRRAKQPRGAA